METAHEKQQSFLYSSVKGQFCSVSRSINILNSHIQHHSPFNLYKEASRVKGTHSRRMCPQVVSSLMLQLAGVQTTLLQTLKNENNNKIQLEGNITA
ncbi:mCG1029182 [Mus musculus]|nr:mCG1029182 [Mus musculus]